MRAGCSCRLPGHTAVTATSVQAYFEARYGREAWEKLHKIPRELWMDYLVWYRQVLRIPVQNGTKVGADAGMGWTCAALPALLWAAWRGPPCAVPCRQPPCRPAALQVLRIEPLDPASASAGFRVAAARSGGPGEKVMHARKVVLATGIQVG